jgi:hypothetical protein
MHEFRVRLEATWVLADQMQTCNGESGEARVRRPEQLVASGCERRKFLLGHSSTYLENES